MLASGLKAKKNQKHQPEEDHITLAEYSDSSSEDESSDEAEVPLVDVKSLPMIAKDDATVARKLAVAKKYKSTVIHLPGHCKNVLLITSRQRLVLSTWVEYLMDSMRKK